MSKQMRKSTDCWQKEESSRGSFVNLIHNFTSISVRGCKKQKDKFFVIKGRHGRRRKEGYSETEEEGGLLRDGVIKNQG